MKNKLIDKEWFTDYSDSRGIDHRRYLDEENDCFLIGIDEKGTKYYYVETQYNDLCIRKRRITGIPAPYRFFD